MESSFISEKDLQGIENDLRSKPICDWDYPKVVIFIPLERTMSYVDGVLPSFMNIARRGANFIWADYGAVAMTRNVASFKFLGTDFTHILMLDLDHQHPADIVERLAKWVIAFPEVNVVGGLNYGRRPPHAPCAHIKLGDEWVIPTQFEHGTLTSVDMLGTGSILINREVFEDIEPPWFIDDFSMWETGYFAGEDTTFSKKCRAQGISLYVDPDVSSPHADYHFVTEADWRRAVADGYYEQRH